MYLAISKAHIDINVPCMILRRNEVQGLMQMKLATNNENHLGYFISPTVILADDPLYKTMHEEIFAPILSIYIYDDKRIDETLELLNNTSPYALTGAIFANDRKVISCLTKRLIDTAGNFYINDKPTGAVVGQQPFGGSRMSGTNDKAGSKLNLLRWTSPRSIKENFNPVIPTFKKIDQPD